MTIHSGSSTQFRFFLLFLILLILGIETKGQQQITVNVSPTVNTSINGHLELDRSKYFNLAGSVAEISKNIKEQSRFDYYFKDLEMTVGRQLGMVFSETRWGNSLREDTNRSGYMDKDYFISRKSPNDSGMDELKSLFGERQGLANHDRHDAYPSFMEQYTIDDSGEYYPVNNDAAAEMVAMLLKHRYTDFQRPSYFELVNEPHWKFWGDQRFADFHSKAKEKVAEMGLNTEVGGPCYSVSNLFQHEYGSLSRLTNFIDNTNFGLDFYSFHTYDYMRWDDSAHDFVGSINSGLPLESVFDAMAAYTFNKYGRELTYVASEHGGYITDSNNRDYALNKLADEHFPGSGFEHEMQKRNIDNFIMVNSTIANTLTFMNHPHIVKKAVPFILLESSGWDPYYYSSLLVKENFDKNSNNWAEARLIDFYRYFKGVKGRRVESFVADTDIQHLSFVEDNTLIMLFHNQSNTPGQIDVAVQDLDLPMTGATLRRLGRADDFRPVLTEESLTSLNGITIGAQESLVLFASYQGPIASSETIDEVVYYSAATGTQFNGSKTFQVSVQDHKKAKYGILRVGISRKASHSKEIQIKLNGRLLDVAIEDCADRITKADGDYATTKIIKVEGHLLKEENTIEVSFPDGKSGGIGAVAMRVGLMDQEREDEPVVAAMNKPRFQFDVYPNPSEKKVTLKTNEAGTLQIMNMSGKMVWRQKVVHGQTTVALDSLPSGNYVLQLIHKGGVNSKKLALK